MPVSGLALIIGGLIFIAMGLGHGLLSIADVSRPTQFTPADDEVRLAMKATNVRFLNARASVWDAWLGFNISHGLGMLLFGLATAGLGLSLDRFNPPGSVLLVPVVIALAYLLLSLRFWFYVPSVSAAIAAACFFLAWWVH